MFEGNIFWTLLSFTGRDNERRGMHGSWLSYERIRSLFLTIAILFENKTLNIKGRQSLATIRTINCQHHTYNKEYWRKLPMININMQHTYIILPFWFFLCATGLNVMLWFMTSDWPSGIFKLFLQWVKINFTFTGNVRVFRIRKSKIPKG